MTKHILAEVHEWTPIISFRGGYLYAQESRQERCDDVRPAMCCLADVLRGRRREVTKKIPFPLKLRMLLNCLCLGLEVNRKWESGKSIYASSRMRYGSRRRRMRREMEKVLLSQEKAYFDVYKINFCTISSPSFLIVVVEKEGHRLFSASLETSQSEREMGIRNPARLAPLNILNTQRTAWELEEPIREASVIRRWEKDEDGTEGPGFGEKSFYWTWIPTRTRPGRKKRTEICLTFLILVAGRKYKLSPRRSPSEVNWESISILVIKVH